LFDTYSSSPLQPLFTRPRGQPFTKQFLLLKIRELLLQAGIPTAGFSGHSIRKGAAVTAAENGISREDIKLLGRWKSDAVDIYINEINESDRIRKLLQLNSQLLNFAPSYPQLSGASEFREPQCFSASQNPSYGL
jgi:site-specific recombinase XerD